MAGDFTTADDRFEHRTGTQPTDPRCSGEYVRRIEGSARLTDGNEGADHNAAAEATGAVTLVGVVHDHPASAHRARTVVAERDPDVLALELPPLAVPLFERYARSATDHGGEAPDTGTATQPPGGEMTAAIRASDADTVGIDGPTLGFAARLARTLVGDRAGLATVRTAVSRFARATGHAVACRAGAVLATITGHEPALAASRSHQVTAADRPAEQARDEQRQVRLARSVTAAFGADRAVATRDSTREAHMADRIATLAGGGDVVAVVGIDHLDPVARRLEELG